MTVTVEVTATNIAGNDSATSLPVTITEPVATPDIWVQRNVGGNGVIPFIAAYYDSRFVIAGRLGANTQFGVSTDGVSFSLQTITGSIETDLYAYGGGVHVIASRANATQVSTSSSFSTGYTNRTITSYNGNYLHYADTIGKFILAGESGALRVSSNGIAWSNVTLPGAQGLTKVASGNGIAVVSGSGNTVHYSSDAITWNSVTIPFASPSDIYVSFGNGMFVAVNAGGFVATSTNGSTWTIRTRLETASVDVGTVSNVGDVFIDDQGVAVFVGPVSATSRGIYVTTDFTNYAAKVSNLPSGTTLSSIVKGGNAWVACGGTLATNITSSILS